MFSRKALLFSFTLGLLILSISLTSAFSFSEWFNSITGKVVDGNVNASNLSTPTPIFSQTQVTVNSNASFSLSLNTSSNTYILMISSVCRSGTVLIYNNSNICGKSIAFSNISATYNFSAINTATYARDITLVAYLFNKSSKSISSSNNVTIIKVNPAVKTSTNTSTNVSCTSFIYSAWSTCNNGQQTRTVTTSLPTGCTGGNPILNQTCTVIPTPGPINAVCTSNSQCITGLVCNSTGRCADPTPITHIACVNKQCATVAGPGANSCSVASTDCFRSAGSVCDVHFGCSPGLTCTAGICVDSTPRINCTDSDGGRNYYISGEATGYYPPATNSATYTARDMCLNSGLNGNDAQETYCQDNVLQIETYNCPFGCRAGACVNQTVPVQVCSDLINKVTSRSDFELYDQNYHFSWNYSYRNTLFINGSDRNSTQYSSGWENFEEENSKSQYIAYNIDVFDERNINLTSIIDEQSKYNICSTQSYWDQNNRENKILVCNYDILTENSDSYDSKQIFWIDNNVLINVYVSSYRYINSEERTYLSTKSSQEILSSLKNNKLQQVDWSKFSIQSPLSDVIAKDLASCSSQISNFVRNGTNESCSPVWNCKIEPSICPPHGYQTRICQDYACGQKKEDQISCSPGLCLGCTTPRWFGQEYSDNVCIPYGFRFASPSGESIKIIEHNENASVYETSQSREYLRITSPTTVTLVLSGETRNYSYNLTIGRETDITAALLDGESKTIISALITPTRISTGSASEEGYVVFDINFKSNESTVDTFNAYCDFDGQIKAQKIYDQYKNGTRVTASCQNNYECASNVCSSGECIDLKSTLQEASRFKVAIANILCRISSALTRETYSQCIANLD